MEYAIAFMYVVSYLVVGIMVFSFAWMHRHEYQEFAVWMIASWPLVVALYAMMIIGHGVLLIVTPKKKTKVKRYDI